MNDEENELWHITHAIPHLLLSPSVQFLLVLGLFVYWLIAWVVQDVDMGTKMPLYWVRFVEQYPIYQSANPFFEWVIEMFSLGVVRHIIPILAGVFLGQWVVVDMVQQLYSLKDREEANKTLGRLLGQWTKPIPIDRRRFDSQRLQHEELLFGGPGTVNLTFGDVAVTEINGRFSRVLGGGTSHKLKHHEYIRSVLDLREQERKADKVTLTTLEGLNVNTSVSVIFRLYRTDHRPAQAHTFTFDADSVRKVAYIETLKEKGGISVWDDLPLGTVIGTLAGLVKRMRLDELLDPAKKYDAPPHAILQRKIELMACDSLRKNGIELVSAKLGAFVLDDRLHSTLLEYWQAFGEKPGGLKNPPQKDIDHDARKKNAIREKMIQGLAKGMEHLQTQGRTTPSSQELVMVQLLQTMQKAMLWQNQRISSDYQESPSEQMVIDQPLPILPSIEAVVPSSDPVPAPEAEQDTLPPLPRLGGNLLRK